MRARSGQLDLAVWRSQKGVVNAWDNRCPHRGMRLSHGFVRGESLACAYHGWHYNSGGHCHYIPAHPELDPPKTIRPVAHSVLEAGGVLWVNTSEDATPVPLPGEPGPVRSITIDSTIELIEAAFAQVSDTSSLIGDMAVRCISDSPRILALSTEKIEDAVVVLFQQADSVSITCHVLASTTYSPEQLVAVSRWCESIRRHAEAACAAGTTS